MPTLQNKNVIRLIKKYIFVMKQAEIMENMTKPIKFIKIKRIQGKIETL